ncbi:hypothetical protein [Asanoa sp. NPDC050611]|uniref:hypothetical protein n=1 Tax=Asanoa sp. NPDC050611 TaxID=3157098 RepID=UPI0033E63FB5
MDQLAEPAVPPFRFVEAVSPDDFGVVLRRVGGEPDRAVLIGQVVDSWAGLNDDHLGGAFLCRRGACGQRAQQQ